MEKRLFGRHVFVTSLNVPPQCAALNESMRIVRNGNELYKERSEKFLVLMFSSRRERDSAPMPPGTALGTFALHAG